jgi:hypothetical protein
LVIALTAGLMISAAAFLLARQATTFFRSEASVSSAQFSSMLGLTRLGADLRRAGFMASPNAQFDPRRCGNMSGWPSGLSQFAAIRIVQGGSTTNSDHTLSTLNGLNPDSIIIGGMFDYTEHYAVQAMFAGGGGWTIVLQNDGAMVRTLLSGQAIADVFKTGRFLRLVDPEGREAYGLITGAALSGANYQVTVDSIPDMPVRDTAGVCGCKLPCVGSLVNPVSRVLYDLRTIDPLAFPQYNGLYSTVVHPEAAKHKGLAQAPRTELIRVELGSDGAVMADTLEVIAEYAVDLKFGITEATPVSGQPPTIVRHPIGSANVYAVANALGAGGHPEDIRAVQVRLSTRVARGDRDVDVPDPANPAVDGVFRFDLGGAAAEPGRRERFARMRSAVTEVQLSNVDVSW